MECLILYIKCFHFHSEAPRSNFLVIVYLFPLQNLQVFENVSSVKQFLHIFVFWWDRQSCQTFYYYCIYRIQRKKKICEPLPQKNRKDEGEGQGIKAGSLCMSPQKLHKTIFWVLNCIFNLIYEHCFGGQLHTNRIQTTAKT